MRGWKSRIEGETPPKLCLAVECRKPVTIVHIGRYVASSQLQVVLCSIHIRIFRGRGASDSGLVNTLTHEARVHAVARAWHSCRD
ncbi:hypothetical protein E2C01_056415 [Portunus trituberculatus]|uniref:Uncharacterized protein n=1 Tax=Portunus trituberculatus TaxID=210409 RepID=A0A5B7GU28_PORTR|nr:hypothetical protein [Portunus trituberculatus]